MRSFFSSNASLLLMMLGIGYTTVDADECWPNTSGGFGGGGPIPIGAGVGASSGNFSSPPPGGPLDYGGTPNPCVASSPMESPPDTSKSPPQSQCQGVGDTTGGGATCWSCSGACTSTCPAAALVGCDLRVDNPHNSMHFPGTVNVIATVKCNRPVSGIEMTVGLARDGQEVNRSTFTNSGNALLKGNVATPCVNGAYQGAAAAIVTFPSGSLPANGTLNANSSTVQITCK